MTILPYSYLLQPPSFAQRMSHHYDFNGLRDFVGGRDLTEQASAMSGAGPNDVIETDAELNRLVAEGKKIDQQNGTTPSPQQVAEVQAQVAPILIKAADGSPSDGMSGGFPPLLALLAFLGISAETAAMIGIGIAGRVIGGVVAAKNVYDIGKKLITPNKAPPKAPSGLATKPPKPYRPPYRPPSALRNTYH